jgi:uncharacterized membrane protein
MAGTMNAQRFSWVVFFLLLLFAVIFVMYTVPGMPAKVASHFDAAGYPNAFMTRGGYTGFVLALAIGLPVALVALLTFVYSHANDMKLPNRDYWLAPEHIEQTRAILVTHAIWFGSLLVCMACFVHWLELRAHQLAPPQLSNSLFGAGLLAFFVITGGWLVVLLMAFRRPAPPRIRREPPLE